MMKITALTIYPIKSLQGISMPEVECTARGLSMDRRYMLVDKDFQFLTQRQHPQMALFSVKMESNKITVNFNNEENDQLSFLTDQQSDYLPRNVKVWSSSVKARSVSKEVDEWFSNKLGQACFLAYMPDESKRNVNPFYGKGEIVSFADGYPYLIANTKSLEDLNSKMEINVKMNRFRTNIEVDGNSPFEEDNWKELQIGNQIFTVSKPCSRCLMTNINPQDATSTPHVLKTLSTYRKKRNKVLFGVNLCWKNKDNTNNLLKVGDEVLVIR